jgi:3-oxoacyl-[acyl-carrier-protein] synthase-3
MRSHYTIEGFGRYVPERVLTNRDLESMVDTSDEWIVSRTGIRERHIAAPGEAVSDMSLQAAKAALADAGWSAEDLSHVYVCTLTPDAYCPPSACLLEEKLGIRGRTAMDVNAACSGFLYGLETARATLCLHPEAKVVLVAAESLSSRTNWADRSTCVLFGDGAGGVVLSTKEPKPGQASIVDVILKSDGSLGHLLTVKGGGSGWPLKLGDVVEENFFVQMAGQEVFKMAVRSMGSVCEEILAVNGLTPGDVDLFVPHQANLRIIEAVGKRLGLDNSKVMVTIDRYGNTSASSIGIALAEAKAEGRTPRGGNVLLASFGGGFTWGAVLLRFA